MMDENPCTPWMFVCENCGQALYEDHPGEFGSYTNHFTDDILRNWCGRMYPFHVRQQRLPGTYKPVGRIQPLLPQKRP